MFRFTVILALLFCLASPTSPAFAAVDNPLHFFAGRTESIGTVKLVMKKPFRSRSLGRGVIKPDGSLDLIQRVEDEGASPRERRWHIRQVGPGKFTGTMSEAKGPVTIDEVNGRYRFRFQMAGSVSVEQWLIPAADWRSGVSRVTIRKFGIRVGTSEAVIRRLDK